MSVWHYCECVLSLIDCKLSKLVGVGNISVFRTHKFCVLFLNIIFAKRVFVALNVDVYWAGLLLFHDYYDDDDVHAYEVGIKRNET